MLVPESKVDAIKSDLLLTPNLTLARPLFRSQNRQQLLLC